MPSPKLSLFAQHSRQWRQNKYVYPVISRRSAGLSIGVNLNPDKACNFDCIYCSVDRTLPSAVRKVHLPELTDELDNMLALAADGGLFREAPFDQTPPPLRRLNDIAFSGDGEPTACPQFREACQIAIDLLARHRLAQAKIVVITNATLLHRPAVASALKLLDAHNGEIWGKLDAGTDEYYQLVDRTRVPLKRVLDNILAAGRERDLVIQSLFMKINGAGPDERQANEYSLRLRELCDKGCRIKLVQVYTIARRPAEHFVQPLDDARLDAIASKIRALGLAVETYYGC